MIILLQIPNKRIFQASQMNNITTLVNHKFIDQYHYHVIIVELQIQGSYKQVSVKFKDFSKTSKRLSYHFQGLKTYEKY